MTVHIDTPGPSLTAARIALVEAELGIKLPGDYRAFLLKYNGGQPTPDGIEVEGLPGSPTDVKVLFGIERGVESSDLRWNKRILSGRIMDSCLPIASDSGGGLFCLSGEGYVVYVDLAARSPTYHFVAENFEAFMAKLIE